MNITIDNFDAYKDKIKNEIDECDYCSLDCELSGITPYACLNLLDSLEDRYLKLKKNDSQYLILQIGLCFFKQQQQQQQESNGNCSEEASIVYDTSSYNFFLFPRTENYKYTNKYNDRYQIQGTAIEFLSKNNFDFNKVFVKGINYMNKEHERKMREKIIERQNESEGMSSVDCELNILEKEAAFSNIMWHLAESKKLVVGHNMIIDMMFILRHFFVTQLPDSCQKFKTCLHSLFSNMLDTKYMAISQPFSSLNLNTRLNDLYIGLYDRVKRVKILNGIYDDQSKTTSKQLHESAYDAYLTGCCYALMKAHLPTLDNKNEFTVNSYENRLFLMKINGYFYLDLINEQQPPPIENMFYVVFPKEWTRKELDDLFMPYGTIAVRWIDDVSAICMLHNKENIIRVNKEVLFTSDDNTNRNSNKNDVKVFSYKDYEVQRKSQTNNKSTTI